MSENIDIIVQDTINDIIVNSSTIVETIDIVVESSAEEITIISNPNDYIININRVIGEQTQSDWDITIPEDPAYIKNKPTIPAAQVNSDWNATTGIAEILNKPTIPTAVTKTSDLTNDGSDGVHPFITAEDIPDTQVNSDWNATSGVAEILNKPTIPAEQVNSDWNATTGKAQILNKPSIPSIDGLATIIYVDQQDALKVDKIDGKGLSTNDFTNTLKTKLDGIQAGAEVNVNADWNATNGDARILNKPTIPSIDGLATIVYVDAQDNLKVDKVSGKGLSTNDFTNILKTKLDGIQAGAEVNVNADWNATTGDAQILNKPTIPAAQVNSDWNATTGVAQILNKPTIPAAVTNTSDLINDGENGVNPFITALDIPTFASADKMVTIGRNATGATLYRGPIVYISGSTGNRPNFVKSIANGEVGSAGTFGVIENDIPNNTDGNCVTIGAIDNLDTRSGATHPFTSDTLVDGDTIYLSPTTAGYITNVKPSAPDHLVYVGKVVRTSPTNGTIVYRIQNGYELQELHNVAINGVSNNQLLAYESSTSLWKNKSITTAEIADSTNKRYVTDANLTTIGNQSGTNTGDETTATIKTKLGITTLSGSNTGDETTATIKTKLGITTLSGSNTGDQDLSGLTPKTTTISTTTPLQGGGDLSANRTLSILQSNTSQSGFLSSTDWNTFNSAYQNKINSAAFSGTDTKTLTLNQQSGGTITANFSIYDSMEIFYNVSTLQNRTIADGGTFEAKKCLFNQLSNLNNI